MPTLKHTHIRAVVLSLILAFSAACGSPPDEPQPPLVLQRAEAQKHLGLPFDAYELTKRHNVVVQRATMKLLRACMASAGLHLAVPDVRASKYPKNATLLGWLGSHQVDRYGYQGPPDLAEGMAAAARRESRPIVIPADQDPVFTGSVDKHKGKPVPAGGCDGWVRRVLNGGEVHIAIPRTDPSVLPERGFLALEQQAAERAYGDAAYLSVVRDWSKCMQRRGHLYAHPDDAQSAVHGDAEGQDGHRSSADDTETAVADRDCREKVNYTGVLRHLVAQFEKQLIEESGDVVRALSSLLRTRFRNAEEVLQADAPADVAS